MTKPEHTRPFDLTDAKAGAPYFTVEGYEARIDRFDGRDIYNPLTGVVGGLDYATMWNSRGMNRDNPEFNLVMTPLGYIDGKPVFVGDEYERDCGGTWATVQAKPTPLEFTHCRWPAPARQYPVTRMRDHEVANAINSELGGVVTEGALRTGFRLAAAVLKHAIDEDQVRITEEVKAREIAIARAVVSAVFNGDLLGGSDANDLPAISAIIARVKD